MNDAVRAALRRGVAIPAHPLALTSHRKLDERRQRALSRYYIAAGAGGLAVAVHTTQFAIRNHQVALLRPVLELAAEEMDRAEAASPSGPRPLVRVAGVCGPTAQAIREAQLALELGYHAGLLSLAALARSDDDALIEHCRAVAAQIPVIGFYLQPAAGGRPLSAGFWRRFAQIDNVVAIKIAPFNRYKTLDVVRAVAESGRDDIALYTGNDDNIVMDLVTPFRFGAAGLSPSPGRELRIVGGLLGHWSVWTKRAVELLESCRAIARGESPVTQGLLALSVEVTDSNAAFFDAANDFAGCIAGLHEVLRRQGLLEGIWCLDENEGLSPGQLQEIDRVCAAYPHLNDDAFVAAYRDDWMRG
jgi:dihydrodipicolinate synthase/N-acetylneuraminate lyase